MFANRVKPLPQRTTREFAGNAKMPTKGYDFEPSSLALRLDRHEKSSMTEYGLVAWRFHPKNP